MADPSQPSSDSPPPPHPPPAPLNCPAGEVEASSEGDAHPHLVQGLEPPSLQEKEPLSESVSPETLLGESLPGGEHLSQPRPTESVPPLEGQSGGGVGVDWPRVESTGVQAGPVGEDAMSAPVEQVQEGLADDQHAELLLVQLDHRRSPPGAEGSREHRGVPSQQRPQEQLAGPGSEVHPQLGLRPQVLRGHGSDHPLGPGDGIDAVEALVRALPRPSPAVGRLGHRPGPPDLREGGHRRRA